LQYEVITKADGAKPAATDQVKVHYHGTLVDGKVFDSSRDRGGASDLSCARGDQGLGQGFAVDACWVEVEVVYPFRVAYGKPGAGADIGVRIRH